MSTLLEAARASNGTTTPNIVSEVLLLVFTTIGLALLSILEIALALGLSYCVPALFYLITTFLPRDHHIVGIAGCFYGYILLLGVTAHNTFLPDSFLSFLIKNFQVLYGVFLISCMILAGLGILRLTCLAWETIKSSHEPFVAIGKEPDDGETTNLQLLALVTLTLGATATAMCLFGPWRPFLASNIDSLKIFGYALAPATAILVTRVAVFINIELTGRACLYIYNGYKATDYLWIQTFMRKRGLLESCAFPGPHP